MSAATQLFPPRLVPHFDKEMLVGAVLVAAALYVLRSFDPATSHLFPPCPFLWLTGWYCPGCGSLRAIHSLLQGNLRQALAFNPFAVLALPFVAYGSVSYVSFRLRGRYLPHIFLSARWIALLGAAIVLFGIGRNLPNYPFSLLAPGAMLAH